MEELQLTLEQIEKFKKQILSETGKKGGIKTRDKMGEGYYKLLAKRSAEVRRKKSKNKVIHNKLFDIQGVA
jgi:hypothetical protein